MLTPLHGMFFCPEIKEFLGMQNTYMFLNAHRLKAGDLWLNA